MALPTWLTIVLRLTPQVLAFTPLAPIAPFVSAGISAAEQIPGATGEQKLAIATQIARTGIAATNAQAGKVLIDPTIADATIQAGINATVGVVNIVHAAHAAVPEGVVLPPAA